MKIAFLLLIGAVLSAVVAKGFSTLRRKWRSGPGNNWMNEAYVAREEAGSWTENELAPGNENRAPASVLGGLTR